MKTLERCQLRHSSVFIVSCEHISNFILIVKFEQANVCRVHIEKTNTFEDKIGYIMPEADLGLLQHPRWSAL